MSQTVTHPIAHAKFFSLFVGIYVKKESEVAIRRKIDWSKVDQEELKVTEQENAESIQHSYYDQQPWVDMRDQGQGHYSEQKQRRQAGRLTRNRFSKRTEPEQKWRQDSVQLLDSQIADQPQQRVQERNPQIFSTQVKREREDID